MAALKGDPLPEVAPIAKGDDEGVYEYFKSKGVFGLIKVSGTYTALLSANFPSHAVHCSASKLPPLGAALVHQPHHQIVFDGKMLCEFSMLQTMIESNSTD